MKRSRQPQARRPNRSTRHAAQRRRRNSFRARLEKLEDRLLLATIVWDGEAGDNDWNNPANWFNQSSMVNDVLPGSADDAQIGAAFAGETITRAAGTGSIRSLASEATLNFTGGDLIITDNSTINGALNLSGTASLRLDSMTLGGTGTLTNGATLRFTRNPVAINAALATLPGAITRLEGNSSLGGINVTVAAGFTNRGDLVLQAHEGANTVLVVASGGTLTNSATGTIRGTGDSPDHDLRILNAQITNEGLIEATSSLQIQNLGKTFTNSGTLSVPSGRRLDVFNGTTVINAGTTLAGDTDGLISIGSFPGVHTVNLNTDLTLTDDQPNVSLGGGNAVVINGPGTLINQTTLALFNDTINSALENQGRLTVRGSNVINGALTTGGNSTIQLQGNPSAGVSTVTIANGFTNNGLIEQLAEGGNPANLTITAGTLTNSATGTIRATGDSPDADQRILNAQITNEGLIEATSSLQIQNLGKTFTNSGTLSVASGRILALFNGTTVINAGTTLAGDTDGVLSIGASPGTHTVHLNADLTLTDAQPNISLGGTNPVVINGPGTLINQTFLGLRSDTINAPLDNQGTLWGELNTTFNGPVTTAPGSSIHIRGISGLGAGTLTVASSFTNHGLIEQRSDGGNPANLTMTTGTLTNSSTGIIRGTGDSPNHDDRILNAQITNEGLIDATSSLQISNASKTFTNSGTLSVASGRRLDVFNGTTVISAGTTLAGDTDGLINLGAFPGAHTLNLNVDLTLTTAQPNLLFGGNNPVTINGPGTLINQTTLALRNETINAPLDNQGTLVADLINSITGELTTAPNSTIRVHGNSVGNATLTVADGFTNNGSIQLRSDGGFAAVLAVTNGTLVNASVGTINTAGDSTAATDRELRAQLDNQGIVNVSSSMTLNKAAADHASSGAINVTAGELRVTQTGTTPTFTNLGAIPVAAGATLTVAGGAFSNPAAGEINGGGTLQLNSASFSGVGIITANVNNSGSTVRPGTSPGQLTIDGDYTQSSSGTLAIEIGGLEAGTEFDQLVVSGADHEASLAGALNVTLIDGFVPAIGDSFAVVEGPTAGNFSTVNLPPLPADRQWQVDSGSVVLSVVALAVDTITDVVTSGSPSDFGQPVTFTATVTSASGIPTGSVTFVDTTSSTTLGTVALDAAGIAAVTVSSLSVGVHNIQASFEDSTGFNASSDSVSQTVNQISTTIDLTLAPNPSAAGETVTFTATVSPGLPSTLTLVGSVTFVDVTTGDTLGSGILDVQGAVSISTDGLAAGSHTIQATFTDSAGNFASSTGTAVQVVNPVSTNTTTTLTSSESDPVAGQPVTFTATVSAAAGSVPTGTVTFQIDGSGNIVTAVDGAGQASFTTAALSSGAHTVTANYTSNSSAFADSSALPLVLTVSAPAGGLPECEVVTLNLPGSPGTATLADDADHPGEGVLIVTGTSGNDLIVIEPKPGNRSQIRVKLKGRVIGTFDSSDVQHIVAFGLAGNDKIIVNATLMQPATLFGNEGNDQLFGGRGADGLDGGAGNDKLFGGRGNDILCGGSGNDFLYGQQDHDLLGGDAGNDKLYGESGNDLLLGNDGNDFLYGGAGHDQLFGQAGDDRIYGDSGDDVLLGGAGRDRLYGGSGRDMLIGGDESDELRGDSGDDILIGGSTVFDDDPDALQALLKDFRRCISFTRRVDDLSTGSGASGIFLDDATLLDDGAADQLFGGGNSDWFLSFELDRVRDRNSRSDRVNSL